MNIISVDVETSGLHPERNSILSIGAVETGKPENTFYAECNAFQGARINDEALRVNGFKRIDVINNPKRKSEAQIITDFIDWVMRIDRNPFMLGMNVSFDYGFIKYAAERAEMRTPFNFRTLDLHTIAAVKLFLDKGKLPPPTLSLNEILLAVGLPKEPDPHNGLTGATCCYQAADKLI